MGKQVPIEGIRGVHWCLAKVSSDGPAKAQCAPYMYNCRSGVGLGSVPTTGPPTSTYSTVLCFNLRIMYSIA